MPKYEVVLQSQTDEHTRHSTITADSPQDAAAICEAAELELVAYDIHKDPYLTKAEVTSIIGGDYFVTETGKVRGPVPRYRAKFHAHLQEKPYEVVSVEEV